MRGKIKKGKEIREVKREREGWMKKKEMMRGK
jgi:hypothetical protein